MINSSPGLQSKRGKSIARILMSSILILNSTPLSFGATDYEIELSLFCNNNLIGDLGGRNNPIDRGISYDIIALSANKSIIDATSPTPTKLTEKYIEFAGAKNPAGIVAATQKQKNAYLNQQSYFRRVKQGAVQPSMFSGARQNWRNIMLGRAIILNLDPSDEARLGSAVREVNPQFSSVRGYRVHRIDEKVAASKQVPIQLNTVMSSDERSRLFNIAALDPTQPISPVLETSDVGSKMVDTTGKNSQTSIMPHMEPLAGTNYTMMTFANGTKRIVGSINNVGTNMNLSKLRKIANKKVYGQEAGLTGLPEGYHGILSHFSKLTSIAPKSGGKITVDGFTYDAGTVFMSRPFAGNLTSSEANRDAMKAAGIEGLAGSDTQAFMDQQELVGRSFNIHNNRLLGTVNGSEGAEILQLSAKNFQSNTLGKNDNFTPIQRDITAYMMSGGMNVDRIADEGATKSDIDKLASIIAKNIRGTVGEGNTLLYRGPYTKQAVLSKTVDILKQ